MEQRKVEESCWDCGEKGHWAGDKVCKQPGAGKYRPAKSEAACCSHEHHSHSAEMLIVQSQKNISDDILSRIPRHQHGREHGSSASSTCSWAIVTAPDAVEEPKVEATDPKFFQKATPIQISELIQQRIGSIQEVIKSKKEHQVSVCESFEIFDTLPESNVHTASEVLSSSSSVHWSRDAGAGALDTACTRSVCSKSWLRAFVSLLDRLGLRHLVSWIPEHEFF